MNMQRTAKNLSHLAPAHLAEAEEGNILPSCLSSHSVNTCRFCGPFSTTSFKFLCFFFFFGVCVISVFKMAHKHSAEVLSSVSKYRKAVRLPSEKIYVLDKLQYGMSYSAVGCEININQSTIYIK